MKKILGLTIAIVVIIGLVAGGTWAYFSDTETITDNTFTAGTIDLTLDPTTGQAVATGQLADLKPCQVGYITVTLTNAGSNPMDVWKMITDVVCTGGAHPESEIAEDPDDTINDIDTVILYDMWIEVGGEPMVYEPGEGDILLVSEGAGLHIDDIADSYIYLDVLEPGESMVIVQSYKMECATTNWAQGDVMTFTMEFFAQQTVGGAPSPTPELPGYGK